MNLLHFYRGPYRFERHQKHLEITYSLVFVCVSVSSSMASNFTGEIKRWVSVVFSLIQLNGNKLMSRINYFIIVSWTSRCVLEKLMDVNVCEWRASVSSVANASNPTHI